MKSGSRRLATIAVAMGVAAFGGWLIVTKAQRSPDVRPGTALDAHRSLGTPSVYKNLAVFPVYDSSAVESNTYVTLDEGLKAKQVSVKESKNGGTVNTLYVTNQSKKPLYLMAGEVVLGGQQDRTLASDTIIQPGKRLVPVTVFCVEHGRWSGRSEFGHSAPALVGKTIRASAMKGEFDSAKSIAMNSRTSGGTSASASPSVNDRTSQSVQVQRMAGDGVSMAQQEVWDGVAAKNQKFKIRNSTGTYRDALTMSGGEAQKSVPAYVKSLFQSVAGGRQVVGAVAAVNGKVIAADIFSDPALFRKLWPKLLKSYAADAVEQADVRGPAKAKIAISAPQVKAFMAAAKDEKSRESNDVAGGRAMRYESPQASVYSIVPGGKAGGSGSAKPLHESTIGK